MEQINENKPIVIALCGKSAAGKDTVAHELNIGLQKKYKRDSGILVSATTRPPRVGENNQIDYYFMTNEEFISNIDNLCCVSYFNNWYYGLPKSFPHNINIAVVNPQGLKDLSYVEDINLIPIYLKASLFTRLKRARKREHSFHWEFIRRAWSDHKTFKEFETFFKMLPNCLIVNNSCGDGVNYPTPVAMIIGHLTRLNILTGGQDVIS